MTPMNVMGTILATVRMDYIDIVGDVKDMFIYEKDAMLSALNESWTQHLYKMIQDVTEEILDDEDQFRTYFCKLVHETELVLAMSQARYFTDVIRRELELTYEKAKMYAIYHCDTENPDMERMQRFVYDITGLMKLYPLGSAEIAKRRGQYFIKKVEALTSNLTKGNLEHTIDDIFKTLSYFVTPGNYN
jgi:hypothetical protein